MFSFFVSFLSCALLTLLVIKTARKHGLGLDGDFGGVQKVHSHAVARIGGIPIFLAVVVASGISILREPQMMAWLATLIACATIALAGGIAAFTKNPSRTGPHLLRLKWMPALRRSSQP